MTVSGWHQQDARYVVQEMATDTAHGLASAEAQDRLKQYGTNRLEAQESRTPWQILREQLTATMVVILFVAAVICAFLRDYTDSIAILVIILLDALLGFMQEFRAEKAMAALQRLSVPTVRVRRDGEVQEIAASALVPGDILLLEAGNLVPADARVLESRNLRLQEAVLTGEAEAVDKTSRALSAAASTPGDRRNMVYMGTVVVYGRGVAVVTETGMRTQLGRIAALIQHVEGEPTPLQRRLNQLGRQLALVALALVGVLLVLGRLRGEPLRLLFLTSVSMAVAAIPEGLPAVVTIALALGAQRMLRRGVLIRKLPAVETLGSVTVICSDKTGTLTENRMTVRILDVAGHQTDLSAISSDTVTPVCDKKGGGLLPENASAMALLLIGAALCNDVQPPHAGEADRMIGDPTETALLAAATQFGLHKADLERYLPRISEIPFSSERKRMTTLHARAAAPLPERWETAWSAGRWLERHAGFVFTKGAVDSLLDVCDHLWYENRSERLDARWRARIVAAHERAAQSGMRVLGVAFRPLANPHTPPDGLETSLVFIGMIGILDPPRAEAKRAVGTCREAGIRSLMITGDHPLTAQFIANEVGIPTDQGVLIGPEIETLSIDELDRAVQQVSVYARVSPEHKLRIIESLQRQGQIVAMTGDGVNDAPALKKADIGIAMGKQGTDVAKESADVVLLDDNFSTIVAGVEEGRVIYDNARKFILYLLSSNFGEIGLMLLAPFCGMPLPLLPLQILWMNLVTDGLPALALSLEPPERNVMRRPPHRPAESLLNRGAGRYIVAVGVLTALVAGGVGYAYWRAGRPEWQTLTFTTLTLSQMGNVLALRSERDSLFAIGLLSNKPLLGAVFLTVLLQLALIYFPVLRTIFHTMPLLPLDLCVTGVASIVVFLAVEIAKWLRHRRQIL